MGNSDSFCSEDPSLSLLSLGPTWQVLPEVVRRMRAMFQLSVLHLLQLTF